MGFSLVPKSVTFNNLERRNGRYLRYFTVILKPVHSYRCYSAILLRVQYISHIGLCIFHSLHFQRLEFGSNRKPVGQTAL